MHARFIGVCTIVAACAAMVASGAPAQSTSSSQAKGGKLFDVRVAIPSSASNGIPFWWALDHGYFKAEGLNIHPTTLQTQGPVSVAAVLSNSVAIAPTDTTDLYVARDRGQDIEFIASQTRDPAKTQNLVSQVFVKPNSGITTWKDLAGKTIAEAALHGDGELCIRKLVDDAGGDSSTIHFVAIPAANEVAALQAGRVDAITPNTPFSTDAVNDGFNTLGDVYATIAPGLSHSIYFAKGSWLRAHPQQAIEFVKALNKGTRYCIAHEEECRQYSLPKYFRIPPSQVDSVNLVDWTTSLEPQGDAAIAKLTYQYHYVSKPVNMKQVFWKSPTYLQNL